MNSAVPLAVAILATLAACSSGGVRASASPTGGNDLQRVLQVGRQYAQCVRDHGHPTFADPVLTNGKLDFPNGQDNKQIASDVQGACGAILDQLPPSISRRQQSVSAADLQHLIQFAQCLRQNGMPEWPDPKSDGTFPIIGTPLAAEGKSQRFITAATACKQFWDKGISGS
jgi:hypothetical protein